MSSLKKTFALPLLAGVLLAACSDSGPSAGPGDAVPRDGLVVTTDEGALEGRMDRAATDLGTPVWDGPPALRDAYMMSMATSISFTELATVAPPVVNGSSVQASSIATAEIAGQSYVFVGYNTAGTRNGAVDVFNVENPSSPKLVASVALPGTNVNGLAWAWDRLYLAEGTSDEDMGGSAIIERLPINWQGIPGSSSLRTVLPGDVATDAYVYQGQVWVSTAESGGVFAVSTEKLSIDKKIDLRDARAISGGNGSVVALSGGSGGAASVSLVTPWSGSVPKSVELGGGLTTPGGKGSIWTDPQTPYWSFVTRGESGVSALQNSTGTLSSSLGLPPVPDGVDPADVVTNGVFGGGSYLFVANGGGGVTIASTNHAKAGYSGTPTLTLLGRVNFSGPLSANAVGGTTPGNSGSGTLFVAVGRGGLKIVRYQVSQTS